VVGSGRADGAVVPDLNDKKGHNHETYDNRISNCFCSLEHGCHGASQYRRIIRCDQGQAGTAGYGSVVAPSVGSYVWPSVGSTNAYPHGGTLAPQRLCPVRPTVGNASGETFAPIRAPRR